MSATVCTPRVTTTPFARALGDLLHELGPTDAMGRVNLKAFLRRLPWEYNAVRKQIVGERTLQPRVIEAIANELHVDPCYFMEYRVWQVKHVLDVCPDLVDACYDMMLAAADARDELHC